MNTGLMACFCSIKLFISGKGFYANLSGKGIIELLRRDLFSVTLVKLPSFRDRYAKLNCPKLQYKLAIKLHLK